MKNVSESLKKKFTAVFELPEEILLNLPLVMMVGTELLIVENHQGLKEYAPDLIELKTGKGRWSFQGHDLEIITIDQNLIKIRGKIEGIQIYAEDGKE